MGLGLSQIKGGQKKEPPCILLYLLVSYCILLYLLVSYCTLYLQGPAPLDAGQRIPQEQPPARTKVVSLQLSQGTVLGALSCRQSLFPVSGAFGSASEASLASTLRLETFGGEHCRTL